MYIPLSFHTRTRSIMSILGASFGIPLSFLPPMSIFYSVHEESYATSVPFGKHHLCITPFLFSKRILSIPVYSCHTSHFLALILRRCSFFYNLVFHSSVICSTRVLGYTCRDLLPHCYLTFISVIA